MEFSGIFTNIVGGGCPPPHDTLIPRIRQLSPPTLFVISTAALQLAIASGFHRSLISIGRSCFLVIENTGYRIHMDVSKNRGENPQNG